MSDPYALRAVFTTATLSSGAVRSPGVALQVIAAHADLVAAAKRASSPSGAPTATVNVSESLSRMWPPQTVAMGRSTVNRAHNMT